MTCKLIKTENYLLVVDDSEIKEGDFCIANGTTYNNTIVKYMKSPCPPPYVSNLSILKKIIAHLSLNNAPYLEGVPKIEEKDLALEFANEIKQDVSQYDNGRWYGRLEGYNTCKQAQQNLFTEEQIREAINLARVKIDIEYYAKPMLKYSPDEIIQSLKQPKVEITFENDKPIKCVML